MTLLEELQARIRDKSSTSGLSFPLVAATTPSNVQRPEGSSLQPLGLSSNATLQRRTDVLNQMQRSR